MAGDAIRMVLDELMRACGGLTTTADRVFEDPAFAIEEGKLPALAFEPVEDAVVHVGESQDEGWIDVHTLRLRVHALTLSPAQRDKCLGEVKFEILGATHIGIVRRYMGATYARTMAGDRAMFSAQMLFEVEFATHNLTPDVELVPAPAED